jgi:hypothetical protein
VEVSGEALILRNLRFQVPEAHRASGHTPCRTRSGSAACAGVCPKGQHGLSTGPVLSPSGPHPRPLCTCPPPSTAPLSVLCSCSVTTLRWKQ